MVHTLVPSDRVEAAAVYGRDGEKNRNDSLSATVELTEIQCGA